MRRLYLIFGIIASTLCGLGAFELGSDLMHLSFLESAHRSDGWAVIPGAIFFVSSLSVWFRTIDGLDNDRSSALHHMLVARFGKNEEPDWNNLHPEDMRAQLRRDWYRKSDAEMRETWRRNERMGTRSTAVAATSLLLSVYSLVVLVSIDWSAVRSFAWPGTLTTAQMQQPR